MFAYTLLCCFQCADERPIESLACFIVEELPKLHRRLPGRIGVAQPCDVELQLIDLTYKFRRFVHARLFFWGGVDLTVHTIIPL